MSETYPYETLDGQRFQRLVQALLTSEFKGIQSLPLSGADGGRDAVQTEQDGQRLEDVLVFQVKFREGQPLGVPTTTELYQWLTGQLSKEKAKVENLKERGARQYMVISNIGATAGLDGGLREKMKVWAEKNLALPTRFWWRDDLDTRLAKEYDLVFKFSLFTGPEAVRAILEARMEDVDINSPVRRSETPPAVMALLSYVSEQYRLESKLRFEQADISGSPLLELFVDVPVRFSRRPNRNARLEYWVPAGEKQQYSLFDIDQEFVERRGAHVGPRWNRYPHNGIGGAELLLDPINDAQRMVIEGAPGQGKSTLGQYVCQVHRIRLLSKRDDFSKLPERHAESPVRLPIRIEFRHLATWFSGINPWTSKEVSTGEPDFWANSIESFIAANVRYSSGGMSFTPTDAVSILSRTPSFIFLDGLDEVPDVKLRGAIVESCQASLNRLESLGADLQVLVTSRPAIFVKAPAFPDDKFEYMNLSELTRPLISSYAGAWMRVRQIPEEQGSEIMQVLDASISQSHVAELARNPMQLAILLWLISVKGRSLPDQRTALYDQYLTAFLDREAVKNSIVRTHRARLLEIHGFLGWVLHGRAESDDSRFAGGDISAEELRDLLHDYLVHEERPTDLVHELFEGAERVFVLVSRIEGKFEFEVQPLREFFAARYLYKTAPRSTYAQPAKGTRPDRLRQLVRNPYWLNVARFFCGWYDRGELADLTRQLKDLCEDPEFSHLSYPRLLIAYILRDCTTAESQRDTRELVETMTDPTGLRFLSTRTSDLKGELSSSGALFPEDCGQQLFVEKLRDAVVNTHTHEIRTDLAQAIRENDRSDLRAAWWLTLKGDARLSHTQWLMRGAETGSIGYISLDAALEIFDPRTATQLDWIRCVEGGRFDVAFHDDERFKCFIAALGDGFTPLVPVSPMGECGRIGSYGQIFNLSSMRTSRATYAFLGSRGLENDPVVSNEMMECIRPLDSLMRVAMQQVSLGGSRAYLRQLSSIIEAAEATFGQSWMCWELALYGATAAGCPAGKRTGFQNSSAPMLSRARQARLAVLDKGYWMDVASSVPESKGLRKAGIAAALSWADPAVLMEVLPYFARRWDDLQQYDIRSIARVLDGLLIVTGSGPSKPKNISKEIILHLPDLPASLLSLLYYRTHHDADPALLRKIKHAYENGEVAENHRSLVASLLLHYNEVIWDGKRSVLSSIRKYFEETTYGSFSGLSNENAYPHTRASETILAAPMSFPMSLVSMADQEVAEIVTGRLRPLRDIALEEDWFNGLQY